MDNFGNFTKQYIKSVVVRDEDGKDVKITLKYSARTPLLYMNYFGTDMFDDLSNITVESMKKNDKLINKAIENGVDALSDTELSKMSTEKMLMFYDKFAVALVATAIYPASVGAEEIRETMLPADFIIDQQYHAIFDAIAELINPVLDDYKKKVIIASNMLTKRT